MGINLEPGGMVVVAVLVIMESRGNPQQLLAASDELRRKAGTAEGLLVRAVAATDDGIVLVHVWESPQARSRWHDNAAHRDALASTGMTALARRTVREYVTDRVQVFGTNREEETS